MAPQQTFPEICATEDGVRRSHLPAAGVGSFRSGLRSVNGRTKGACGRDVGRAARGGVAGQGSRLRPLRRTAGTPVLLLSPFSVSAVISVVFISPADSSGRRRGAHA